MYDFIIDKDKPYENIEITTETGLLIATGCNRIVIGKRGPYVEFLKKHIIFDNIIVPKNEEWRLHSKCCFYNEYRSKDDSYIKIYEQKETVVYADYKIGFFYISPEILYINSKRVLNDESRYFLI